MGRLSTHVLDTVNGKPAEGVAIELFALEGRSAVRPYARSPTPTGAPMRR